MLPGRFALVGSALLAAGMLVIGLAIGVGANFATTASAGLVTCVTATPPNLGEIQAEGALLQQLPTCTSVPTARPRTHTPTTTATAAATSTAVPVTPVPATQAPAPTQPGGGTEGVGVKPPDTGDGSGLAGGSSVGLALLLGGIALTATGAASVLVGVRRRS